MTTDSQARRAAEKAGLKIVKARGVQHFNQRGGYQLISSFTNIVIDGENFELSAEDVIKACKLYELVGTAFAPTDSN